MENARMAEINESLKTTYLENTEGKGFGESLNLREKINFKNGFSLSAQASRTSYCGPRENNVDFDFYYEVELALFKNDEWTHPGRHAELIDFVDLWQQDDEDKTGTHVAGYVPKDDFWRLIEKLEVLP